MRGMRPEVGNVGVRLKKKGKGWAVVAFLFADDNVLFAKSEEELQRLVDEFYCVCPRRKLKVNAGKSKVMVFEKKGSRSG